MTIFLSLKVSQNQSTLPEILYQNTFCNLNLFFISNMSYFSTLARFFSKEKTNESAEKKILTYNSDASTCVKFNTSDNFF